MKPLLVTIDGPAGAGKTTVSRMLADRLGYRCIDTGALYRAVALEAMAEGLSHQDEAGLENLCRGLKLAFVQSEKGTRLLSNGSDITDQIRTPEISMFSSAASAMPVVRRCLLGLQRELGREKAAVFEGRDMGTVVFPDADIKFFLDASQGARALRRYNDSASASSQTLTQIERDIRNRDEGDRGRALAPLKPAEDAILIDSTDITADQVVDLMMSCIAKKGGGLR